MRPPGRCTAQTPSSGRGGTDGREQRRSQVRYAARRWSRHEDHRRGPRSESEAGSRRSRTREAQRVRRRLVGHGRPSAGRRHARVRGPLGGPAAQGRVREQDRRPSVRCASRSGRFRRWFSATASAAGGRRGRPDRGGSWHRERPLHPRRPRQRPAQAHRGPRLGGQELHHRRRGGRGSRRRQPSAQS